MVHIIFIVLIYTLYVANAQTNGRSNRPNTRRNGRHNTPNDDANYLQFMVQLNFCETKSKWIFMTENILNPYLEKQSQLKPLQKDVKLEIYLEGTGLPQSEIKKVANFVHELPDKIKQTKNLRDILMEHGPEYIKNAHKKLDKIYNEIDEIRKRKSLTEKEREKEREKMEEKIDSLWFEHPEHPQLVTIEKMLKNPNPDLQSSIYYVPPMPDEYEDLEKNEKKLDAKYKKMNIKIPPIPPSHIDDYIGTKFGIDDLLIIPSYDYNFKTIQWTEDEIKKEPNDEEKNEMYFENKFVKYLEDIHDRRKQDNDWNDLVRGCLHYGPTQVSGFGEEQRKNEYNKAQKEAESHLAKKHWKPTANDIYVLMLYTNYDRAQFYFTKTFREYNKINWQRYIIWKTALDDAFFKYTTWCNHHLKLCGMNNVKWYYHGMTHRCHDYLHLMSEPYIDWKGPLSTTTSRPVAIEFATNHGAMNGQVFYFQIHPKSQYYPIPVSQYSDYPGEHEYLFYNSKLIFIKMVNTVDAHEFWTRFHVRNYQRKCLCDNQKDIKIYEKDEWYKKMSCPRKEFKYGYRYGFGKCAISYSSKTNEKTEPRDKRSEINRNPRKQDIYPIYNKYDMKNKLIESELFVNGLMMMVITIFCFIAICGIIGLLFGFVVAKIVKWAEK